MISAVVWGTSCRVNVIVCPSRKRNKELLEALLPREVIKSLREEQASKSLKDAFGPANILSAGRCDPFACLHPKRKSCPSALTPRLQTRTGVQPSTPNK